MAAILCESLSKILRGACDGLGVVLCLPCRACGFATDELAQLCRSPFCLYLSVALGTNFPPVVFAGRAWRAVGGADDGCRAAARWLALNALLCLVNMAAALYISAKVTHDAGGDAAAPFVSARAMDHGAHPHLPVVHASAMGHGGPERSLKRTILDSTATDTQSRSLSRVREILCYDPFVAVYILVGMCYMVWQTMGIGHSYAAMDCGEGLEDAVWRSLACGFFFISFGGVAFACSFCCLARH